MLFFEHLTLGNLARLSITREPAFYGTKSLGARYVEPVLARFGVLPKATQLSFGDVDTAPGIRRQAYQTAEICLEQIGGERWAREVAEILSIDFWLLVRKFYFDDLYAKFEFLELALRYAIEHPDGSHRIHVEREFLMPYKEKLRSRFKVRTTHRATIIWFWPIFLLPIFLKYFARRHGVAGGLTFTDQIVCQVDGEKTYEMFSNIFSSHRSKQFVIERRNEQEFSEIRRRELQIRTLGLTPDGYRFLRRAVYGYIGCCVRHFGEVASYGGRLFRLFYVLMLGKAETIDGTGNLYFTYEHLITVKAARNEFLKRGGNRSVFVPMNAHVSPRYFHSEIFVNYDVMCAAGRHTTDLYRKRRSVTDVFLPTGPYESHRGSIRVRDRSERISRLKAFKGDSVAVTIVSPGICEPTYSHEVKLIRLACELSKKENVKVFIRLKPVPPAAPYADFYEAHTAGCESILLTYSEYDLCDFLEVTDLFVTSISNAACDLALGGGDVVFIDYMKDPELFLSWSEVEDVVLTEEESAERISEWILGNADVRRETKDSIARLNDYIGYMFSDFDSYKGNLLAQLQVGLGHHPSLATFERQALPEPSRIP
jgi:hypothetical protein